MPDLRTRCKNCLLTSGRAGEDEAFASESRLHGETRTRTWTNYGWDYDERIRKVNLDPVNRGVR